MDGFDPVGFGKRISDELGRKAWDVKTLQRELRRVTNEARGTSYGAVWSYVNGQAPLEPRREVIEGMARLFGVRPDYLLIGGPRTEEELRARTEVAAISEGTAQGDEGTSVAQRKYLRALKAKRDIWRGLGLPWPEEATELPDDGADLRELTPEETVDYLGARFAHVNLGHIPHWVPALAEVRRRYGHATIDDEQLGRALRATLDALDIDPAAAVGRIYNLDEWLNDYITAMAPVLLALAPERSRQRADKEADHGDEA